MNKYYTVVTDKLEPFGLKRGNVIHPMMLDRVSNEKGTISISETIRLKPEWFTNIASDTERILNSL